MRVGLTSGFGPANDIEALRKVPAHRAGLAQTQIRE
jgi:hypothetical protein